MAEGGKENEGESSMVKRELFPDQGSSVDKKSSKLSLLIKITKENGESLPYKKSSKLSLLIKITKENGESLPYGFVNDQLIIELFQNVICTLPSSILILNDQYVLLDFPTGTLIFEMAQAVHGRTRFCDTAINV